MRTRVDILKSAFAGSRLPQICPACGKADPDSRVVVTSFTLFSGWIPLKESIGRFWRVDVPACSKCRLRIVLGPWIRRICFAALVLTALILWYLVCQLTDLQHFDKRVKGYSLFLFLLLVFLADYGLKTLYTPPFEMSTFSDRLLFYFRDAGLAADFARLNGVESVFDDLNDEHQVLPAPGDQAGS
ncbi:MAG: hypothetical protein ACAI44_00530 [Candidatus Sericytochromatia bacterium]